MSKSLHDLMDQSPPATSQTTSTASAAQAADRIRRNTACTSCRDSKVKCNASLTPNAPCLRCSKLRIPCVVDKSHKRSTRRSKLEQIERELKSIKDAVSTKSLSAELPSNALANQALAGVLTAAPNRRPEVPQRVPSDHVYPPVTAGAPLPPAQVPTPAQSTPTSGRSAASKPRALGSRIFTTSDIDFYFDSYFSHFHPYFPIIRVHDPDKCYQSSSVLFWTIISIACQRYAKDAATYQFLTETLPREIWSTISRVPLPYSSINALILLCAWPLPTIRLMSDPSPTFASVAANACILQGLHTGRGCHPEFCYGPRKAQITDEEALYTWLGCSIVAQRVAAINGCPPICSMFDESMDRDAPPVGSYFGHLFRTQKFCNRANRMVSASLGDRVTIPESLVRLLEDEFETETSLLNCNTDLDTFTCLAARLEIQACYFFSRPTSSSANLQQNIYRAYRTAQSVVDLGLKLEWSEGFLSHAPHYIFRSILDATCIIFRVTISTSCSLLDASVVETTVKKAIEALRISSIQEGDLAMRIMKMLDSYWSLRHLLPLSEPASNYPHRIGVPVTWDCLRRCKMWLDSLRASNAPPEQADEAQSRKAGIGQSDAQTKDSFQDIDWTALMNDFEWEVTESRFLGLP